VRSEILRLIRLSRPGANTEANALEWIRQFVSKELQRHVAQEVVSTLWDRYEVVVQKKPEI
jgi:hypothetical protein